MQFLRTSKCWVNFVSGVTNSKEYSGDDRSGGHVTSLSLALITRCLDSRVVECPIYYISNKLIGVSRSNLKDLGLFKLTVKNKWHMST